MGHSRSLSGDYARPDAPHWEQMDVRWAMTRSWNGLSGIGEEFVVEVDESGRSGENQDGRMSTCGVPQDGCARVVLLSIC